MFQPLRGFFKLRQSNLPGALPGKKAVTALYFHENPTLTDTEMSFLLEILAFLQLTLLPGLLLLGLLGLRPGFVRTLLLSFALSGVLNYLFVFAAACSGVFTRPLAFAFVALELAAVCWLWRGELLRLLKGDLLETGRAFFERLSGGVAALLKESPSPRAFNFLLFGAALFCLSLAVYGFLASTGSIFNAWDAVLSWNRWATGWYHGAFPTWTNGYPQLVPANWALCYMLQGEPLQYVPKLCVGLYEPALLLMLIDLAISRRSAGLLAAAPLFAWLLRNVELEKFGGDVDLIVTFMGFAAFYCVMLAPEARTRPLFLRLLAAASIMACSAAAAKQSGIFILAMLPIVAWLLLRGRFGSLELGRLAPLKGLAVHLLLALLIAAPVYIGSKIMVMKGLDKYKVKFVTEDIYAGRGYLERSIISSKMLLLRLELGMHEIPGARWCNVDMKRGLAGAIDFYKPYLALAGAVAALTLLLLALALSMTWARWPLLLLAFPHCVIWGLLYCYDLRNLTIALPFLALGLGLGLEQGVRLLAARFALRGWAVLAAAAALAAYLGLFLIDGEALRKSHEHLETLVGDEHVNAKIYACHESSPIKGKIATDYEFVNFLPGIKGSLHYEEFSDRSDFELDHFRKSAANPDVGFLLVPNYTMQPIKDEIAAKVKSGEMELVFHDFGYMFVKINRKPADAPAPEGNAR